MKKEIRNIGLSNLAIFIAILLITLISDGANGKESITACGIIMLLLCAANFFAGLIFIVVGLSQKAAMNYGLSMLMYAGICLLGSFTFCSISFHG